MCPQNKHVVVMLTVGKADNGKRATLAFSCALSALAMGNKASVFLTSDGAVWGYQGSGNGISVQGFPPLDELITQYHESGGRILLCSVCHKTCGFGGPGELSTIDMLPQIEIGGFVTMLELATEGIVITF
ncbi:MAG: DsrE family protein [Planctomycetaceae bacterium]